MAAVSYIDFRSESDQSSGSPISSSSSSESEGVFEFADKLSIADNFTCNICRRIIRDFVELPCKHAGCRRCVRKWGKETYK